MFNLCHRHHFRKSLKNIVLLIQECSYGIYRKLGITNLGQDVNMTVVGFDWQPLRRERYQ